MEIKNDSVCDLPAPGMRSPLERAGPGGCRNHMAKKGGGLIDPVSRSLFFLMLQGF
jgi:hypothetical protein